jgi:outer membrane protein TolC
VIPTDQVSLESAMASYRAGRAPFVTVLEALNALYADRSNLLGRIADAQKLRVAIEEADFGAGAAMPSGGAASNAMSSAGEPGGSPNPMR